MTLIKSHPEFKQKRAALFRDFFEVPALLEEVTTVVKRYDDKCNAINEITGKNIDTFEIYLLILSHFGCYPEVSKLKEFYQETEVLFLANPPILLDHFTRAFFDNLLAENKRANILSNTGFIKGETMRTYFESIDYLKYFDFQLFSDELILSKPNPALFELVELNLRPGVLKKDVIHIGDNYKADYLSAISYGFNAYLIQNDR